MLSNGTRWYQLLVEQGNEALRTSNAGLTSNEVEARLEMYEYNELEVKKRGLLIRFLLQFHNALPYALMAAGSADYWSRGSE